MLSRTPPYVDMLWGSQLWSSHSVWLFPFSDDEFDVVMSEEQIEEVIETYLSHIIAVYSNTRRANESEFNSRNVACVLLTGNTLFRKSQCFSKHFHNM